MPTKTQVADPAKLAGTMPAPAIASVGLSRHGGVAVIGRRDIPALLGYRPHGVDPGAQQRPEFLKIAGAGESARRANDGDRKGLPRLGPRSPHTGYIPQRATLFLPPGGSLA